MCKTVLIYTFAYKIRFCPKEFKIIYSPSSSQPFQSYNSEDEPEANTDKTRRRRQQVSSRVHGGRKLEVLGGRHGVDTARSRAPNWTSMTWAQGGRKGLTGGPRVFFRVYDRRTHAHTHPPHARPPVSMVLTHA